MKAFSKEFLPPGKDLVVDDHVILYLQAGLSWNSTMVASVDPGSLRVMRFTGGVTYSVVEPGTTITEAPTTSPAPTASGQAVFDEYFRAPRCSQVSNYCDSNSLLILRCDFMGQGEPSNRMNTIDTCPDNFHMPFENFDSGIWVDRIIVR